jgi:hypothetical protein
MNNIEQKISQELEQLNNNLEPEQPKRKYKGRAKGLLNKQDAYELYQKNVLTDNFSSLGKFKTYNEISIFLKSHGVKLSAVAIQKIYSKNNHKMFLIKHL